MEVLEVLSTILQGEACPEGLSVHKSTLKFRRLCMEGDISRIKQYLSRLGEIEDVLSIQLVRHYRLSPSFCLYDGFREAIRSRHLQIVKFLMDEGLSLSYTDSNGLISAAVEGAAFSGQTDILDFFVEQGWDLKRSEFSSPEGYYPLKLQFSSIS
jgi:hypothetical protein